MQVETITERQLEVARLVYIGRTDREIGDELHISRDGAKYHVSELRGRLGVLDRAGVADWYEREYAPRRRFHAPKWVAAIFGSLAVAAGAKAPAMAVAAPRSS